MLWSEHEENIILLYVELCQLTMLSHPTWLKALQVVLWDVVSHVPLQWLGTTVHLQYDLMLELAAHTDCRS